MGQNSLADCLPFDVCVGGGNAFVCVCVWERYVCVGTLFVCGNAVCVERYVCVERLRQHTLTFFYHRLRIIILPFNIVL